MCSFISTEKLPSSTGINFISADVLLYSVYTFQMNCEASIFLESCEINYVFPCRVQFIFISVKYLVI